MKKFFKSIYGKILCGIIAVAIGFGVGYFVMPTKTETITKTETVTVETIKYVTTTDKTKLDKLGADVSNLEAQIAALQTSKTTLQNQITALTAANSDAVLKLKAFRTTETTGWVTNLESKITGFNADIVWYNNAIKAKQDLLVSPNRQITLLQASINAKQLLINALTADDPIGNLAAIRDLEDEIIDLRADIVPFETIITGLNADIAALNVDKAAVSAKIVLDQKCISEIGRYINDGTAFSAEVSARLHVLGLI